MGREVPVDDGEEHVEGEQDGRQDAVVLAACGESLPTIVVGGTPFAVMGVHLEHGVLGFRVGLSVVADDRAQTDVKRRRDEIVGEPAG